MTSANSDGLQGGQHKFLVLLMNCLLGPMILKLQLWLGKRTHGELCFHLRCQGLLTVISPPPLRALQRPQVSSQCQTHHARLQP